MSCSVGSVREDGCAVWEMKHRRGVKKNIARLPIRVRLRVSYVREHIPVRQHHALWFGGGSGRVKQAQKLIIAYPGRFENRGCSGDQFFVADVTVAIFVTHQNKMR